MNTKLLNSLWVLIILLMLSGCKHQEYTSNHPVEITTKPYVTLNPILPTSNIVATIQKTETATGSNLNNSSPDVTPPITLVSLKDQTIHFDCLDRNKCIPDVDLAGHALFDSPFHLGRVFYWNQESIYLTLLSDSTIPEKMDIIHVNPKTGDVKSIKSPDEAENSLLSIGGGRLILARNQGQTVYIIEPDLSITKVAVGIDIYKMIVDGSKVIALNQVPVEKDGQIYVDISVVDVVSKVAKSNRLNLPGIEMYPGLPSLEQNKIYLMYVEGVGENQKKLYCVFVNGDEPGVVKLGTFDVLTPEVIVETQGGVSAMGYSQYHEILYLEYSEKSDGGPGASLYNMSTGQSLIDSLNNPDWRGKKLLVVPFGDNLLLGRSDEVILLSPTGAILRRFNLPEEWLNQDYRLMIFEK